MRGQKKLVQSKINNFQINLTCCLRNTKWQIKKNAKTEQRTIFDHFETKENKL